MKFTQLDLPYIKDTSNLLQQLQPLGRLVALESSLHEHENGRWSIITAQPIEQADFFKGGNFDSFQGIISRLEKALPKIESDLPFCGGVIGHSAYDLGTPKTHQPHLTFSNQPLLMIGLYTWGFAIDHMAEKAYLAHWNHDAAMDVESLSAIYKKASNPPQASDFKLTSEFSGLWNKNHYKNQINKTHEYILSGDVYQINLAQCFKATYTGSSLFAYGKLKQQAQVPFACYFEGPNFSFCSASPELFIESNDNKVTTKPIKGTRPRGISPDSDLQLKNELANSPKDKAENLMIVDLLRNDLSINCKNVRVPSLFDIESFSTVHHLVSTVEGVLKNKDDILKLYLDALPGGSITGTPKKRAMEIISELESFPRSFYCGSTFLKSTSGHFTSNILIRSFLFEDDAVYCWGGGGIVADSNWQDEYQESLDKVSKLMACLSD